MNLLRILSYLTTVISCTVTVFISSVPAAEKIQLTPEHIEAVNRQRRIILQDDVLAKQCFRHDVVGQERMERVVDYYMSKLEETPNQVDSIWFEWGEGNTAIWPSKVLPQTTNIFPKWWESGVDPIRVLLDEARQRGREVFFSYRMNGSDNDSMFDPPHKFDQPTPLKAEHPDWLINLWHPFWDFSQPGVRDLKLRAVQEVAQMYDFDGIQVDFARVAALFPEGQQWVSRDKLTEFMRSLRVVLLDVERQRGRPLLLAARVPENLMGCHFDGMDVETWARENLVDIFVLGCRSSNVDVAAFRRITAGTEIKLYPGFDFHHVSDGYGSSSIEVARGVYANHWNQRPDGVQTFNLYTASPESASRLGVGGGSRPPWDVQCQILRDCGSPETLRFQDKVFYVQRRGGEQGPPAANFHTPRWGYFCTNMFESLPATLDGQAKADTLLTLKVADDVQADAEKIKNLTLRLLLGSPADLEVRVNNLLLEAAGREGDWQVFPVQPDQLAVGGNLVGVKLVDQLSQASGPIRVEKLELHIDYR